jgi:hypothetical protein
MGGGKVERCLSAGLNSAVWTKQRERLLGAGGALLVTPAALEAAETIEAHRKAGVTDY